ncbi:nitrogen fixation protein NifZ [Caldichromatium japonicum]|uniref:Nitrogen fixation protein NifZ n=1 Tax=Caldichromatium japonicum TaxID=2699430 RepID=A0A6G7VF67_9GAMM|nr:nitrogen fixation protein NifZ [Caldichromatium japonicum]QIK38540.1 nitrogen fixation protein NifZ [Caldichromatium japonicum]
MIDGARWDYGDAVRVTRNVRNDGTYPGAATGELLVRRGSVGYVVDIGTFLQDQIIYSVHFLEAGKIVGCRQEELIDLDEPWVPSRYEVRERVRTVKALVIDGEVLVPLGAIGEILRVIRETDPPVYHLHFDCQPGRVFVVPEAALEALEPRHD